MELSEPVQRPVDEAAKLVESLVEEISESSSKQRADT